MPTTDELCGLSAWLQVHDSAFPAGRLVHSNGFEEWLNSRPDSSGHDLEQLALDHLEHAVAPLDAAGAALAWTARAGATASASLALRRLDAVLDSHKLSESARIASHTAGTQLAATARRAGLADDESYLAAAVSGHTPGNLAIVEGALQAALGIPRRIAVLGVLQSAFAGVLSAAVRLGRLGPLSAQRMHTRSRPRLVMLVDRACATPVEELRSSTVLLEICGMRHETRTNRLFAT
ncbi:urease accessory UreF family protein [Nocardia sp. NPDC052254]|uniref:urease accessory protein UreF n=1 Tax=Nocardia sp. NPDC052254 TaxID=3155681 RepID=UPI0034317E37